VTMKITVKLAGAFVHTVGFSQKELEVEPGTTIGDILATVAIDRARPMVIARNGHGANEDEEVRDGDRILVSPIFSGG
jgi:sulfur carrier protein ThiS